MVCRGAERRVFVRDRDVRDALNRNLARRHAQERDTLIINEMGLCRGLVRIDVTVVNGLLSGYEIKSDADTLERLPVQSEAYSRALDQVTIVAGRRHAELVQSMVPDWWGISEAVDSGDGVVINQLRGSQQNPRIDPAALVQLLWRDEALSVLDEAGLSKGMLNKPCRDIWDKLATNMPVDELRGLVRERLKIREGWRSDALRM